MNFENYKVQYKSKLLLLLNNKQLFIETLNSYFLNMYCLLSIMVFSGAMNMSKKVSRSSLSSSEQTCEEGIGIR